MYIRKTTRTNNSVHIVCDILSPKWYKLCQKNFCLHDTRLSINCGPLSDHLGKYKSVSQVVWSWELFSISVELLAPQAMYTISMPECIDWPNHSPRNCSWVPESGESIGLDKGPPYSMVVSRIKHELGAARLLHWPAIAINVCGILMDQCQDIPISGSHSVNTPKLPETDRNWTNLSDIGPIQTACSTL